MKRLLTTLLGASHKASSVAQLIRQDSELFSLLIQEKTGSEKNCRFAQDFKTLADVLIQEMVRWEVSKEFPEMQNNVFGEESNIFSLPCGKSIKIEIKETSDETARMLEDVIQNHPNACILLANKIHENSMVSEDVKNVDAIKDLDFSNIGIWIDPIDSTNEYIKNSQVDEVNDPDNISSGGLSCVTVLIGAFLMNNGQPILGVVSQPFYFQNKEGWQDRLFWGVSYKDYNIISSFLSESSTRESSSKAGKPKVVLSGSENPVFVKNLQREFDVEFSPGAGYKLLCVILGLADIYLLTKNTTHFWDTNGPHAILNAMGGGVINFEHFRELENPSVEDVPESFHLNYKITNKNEKNHFSNQYGLIAFKDFSVCQKLNKCLK